MLPELESQLVTILQTVFDRFGWFGVAGALAFENATGILPSEVILGLAGWFLLAAHDAPPAEIFAGGLYAGLGSTAGASALYWFARFGGRPLVERVARRLRLNPQRIAGMQARFQRRGPALVLFGRMLPGIRTWITIPAGLARMRYHQFFMYTFIGTYVWSTLLLGLGYAVGHEWAKISDSVEQLTPWLFIALVMLGGLAWLMPRIARRWLRRIFVLVEDEEESAGGDRLP